MPSLDREMKRNGNLSLILGNLNHRSFDDQKPSLFKFDNLQLILYRIFHRISHHIDQINGIKKDKLFQIFKYNQLKPQFTFTACKKRVQPQQVQVAWLRCRTIRMNDRYKSGPSLLAYRVSLTTRFFVKRISSLVRNKRRIY